MGITKISVNKRTDIISNYMRDTLKYLTHEMDKENLASFWEPPLRWSYKLNVDVTVSVHVGS